MDRCPLTALILFLGALGWGVVTLTSYVYARRTARPELARMLAVALAGGAGLYLAALGLVSLTSRERVLKPGERKSFSGFYLDSHLGFVVAGVRTEAIGTERLYIVDLKIQSDARRITMTPGPLDITLIDAAGRSWPRDRAAEPAATGRPWRDILFDEPLPAGAGYTRTIVFRLPADTVDPKLLVREAFWADRLIETLLIGDDDSWLHRRTVMALTSG